MRTVAITSGKGGVGKSTVTAGLALAMHRAGLAVGILDADLYGPSFPEILVGPRADAPADPPTLPMDCGGIRVASPGLMGAPGEPHIVRGPMAARVISQLATAVPWGELDILLVDTPPGTGDIHLTLSQALQLAGAVAVTTPQRMALADARRSCRMLDRVSVPLIGIIETMAGFLCPGCEMTHPLFDADGGEELAREFTAPVLGSLPFSPKLRSGCDEGLLVGAGRRELEERFAPVAESLLAGLDGAEKAAAPGLGAFDLEWRAP